MRLPGSATRTSRLRSACSSTSAALSMRPRKWRDCTTVAAHGDRVQRHTRMHILVPALPKAARALSASIGEMQLTMSVYVFGFAVGQHAYGPLSDRYGRRRDTHRGIGALHPGGAPRLLCGRRVSADRAAA